MRRIVVFIAGLLIFLNCHSNIMAACSLDRHANCVGTCSGGSCSDENGGCECIANNPPTPKPTRSEITEAPKPTELPTAIPCPNGVCPTNSPTGWNKPCDNGSYCGPGDYCCGPNNANCCPIGPVEPTNDPDDPDPTAYIRVRTYNPELTPFRTGNDLCKVNCTNSPCELVSCVDNSNMVDFAGASSNRGGGINSSGLTVLGVTPIENNVVADTGNYYPRCRGLGDTFQCYTWPTTLSTGSRVVRFIVATITPAPSATIAPTATPAPGPWIKLKDTSFISKNSLYNHIPLAPVAFDADDDGNSYFIINSLSSSSGLVSAPSLNITET